MDSQLRTSCANLRIASTKDMWCTKDSILPSHDDLPHIISIFDSATNLCSNAQDLVRQFHTVVADLDLSPPAWQAAALFIRSFDFLARRLGLVDFPSFEQQEVQEPRLIHFA